jgi:hypothetical protein
MRHLVVAVTLAAFLSPLGFAPASAQTDREKAWATCLAAVSKLRSGDPEAERERVAAFTACMAKLGQRP